MGNAEALKQPANNTKIKKHKTGNPNNSGYQRK
jgi:hypothetical protein